LCEDEFQEVQHRVESFRLVELAHIRDEDLVQRSLEGEASLVQLEQREIPELPT